MAYVIPSREGSPLRRQSSHHTASGVSPATDSTHSIHTIRCHSFHDSSDHSLPLPTSVAVPDTQVEPSVSPGRHEEPTVEAKIPLRATEFDLEAAAASGTNAKDHITGTPDSSPEFNRLDAAAKLRRPNEVTEDASEFPAQPRLALLEEAEAECIGDDTIAPRTLRRWLDTLRLRKSGGTRYRIPQQHLAPLVRHHVSSVPLSRQDKLGHRKSNSKSSSIRFVTTMKSATITLASTSIATMSRRQTKAKRDTRGTSQVSDQNPRGSTESKWSIMDAAAQSRSCKRRHKLEELIRTEESYIADLRALSNAYLTLLSHQSNATTSSRSTAQRVLAQMLSLHEDVLIQIHQLVPFAEYDQRTPRGYLHSPVRHARPKWHSVDAVPTLLTLPSSKLETIRQERRSLSLTRSREREETLAECSAHIVSLVASLFSDQISSFTVYQEFAANFETFQRDIDEVQQATTSWPDFDKAIEAISSYVNPIKFRDANRKKATTLKDLMIKPIQRVPRYELLFGDFYKLTPVCDDPNAHIVIEELLVRLKSVSQQMNDAKQNLLLARLLETTSILSKRLSFSNQVPRTIFLRLLGQVRLCGCLYVTYRTRDFVKGLYAIVVLFDTTLLLATTADDDQYKYNAAAGVALANTTIVETDSGRGLQCYTTPHSWKLVFEHCNRMYEIIFTACSAVEAEVWRHQLSIYIETQAPLTASGTSKPLELHSPLIAEMRSIGQAFGKQGSFARRGSVRRTQTLGPTTDLTQVIIKNTRGVKDGIDAASNLSLQLPRSQSVATPSHIQTLAPRRADRIRLEGVLSDIWTRDLLPYPGMAVRRADPLRASANHVIRKFSRASIASNFSSSKRSVSHTSISNFRIKEDMPPPPKPTSHTGSSHNTSSKNTKQPVIDFHNDPEAFLPADFELQPPGTGRRKSAFRTLTMTMERPFSPVGDSRHSALRRTQSVKAGVTESALPCYAQLEKADNTLPMQSRESDKKPNLATIERAQATDYTCAMGFDSTKVSRKSKSKSRLLNLFR